MKLQDRLRIAMGALAGRDILGEEIKQVAASVVQPWGAYGQAKSPDTRLEPLVKSGWRRNELIFACVGKKASTTAQVALKVSSKRTGQFLEAHPLQALIEQPNPMMTESDLWSSVLILQDFAGNAYFEKVRSAAGRTVQLWPMRPDWIKAVDDERGNIVGYFYNVPSKPPKYFDADDILAFRTFDPLNGLFGYPPVAVCARSGDMDNSVTDYVRLLFEEGGVPPGILSSTQSINETVATQIRDLWMMRYGGVKNWTKGPAVLGHDTKYQATGLGLKEMGIDILDRRSEGKICLALRVPQVIVGTNWGLERATLDNVKAYQKTWWQNDLMPIYKSFADTLRQQLLPEFGDEIGVEWDFAHVPALQDDINEIRERGLNAFKAGAITRNAFNALWDLPDLGPTGEVYVMSSLLIEVPAPAARQPAKLIEGSFVEHKAAENLPEHEQQRRTFERKIKREVMKFFDEELGRIETHLKELMVRKTGRKQQAKQEHPADPVFWSVEGKILYNVLFQIITDATKAAALDAFSAVSIDVGVSWELINKQVPTWAAAHTEAVVSQMSKTLMEGFLKEFEPWLESGEPLPALIKNLEKYYSPMRAEWVGVSETTRAFANGNIDTWKQMNGYVESFDVVTAEDDDVCPICQGKKAGNPHSLDGERPSFHVKCRCGVRPNIRK